MKRLGFLFVIAAFALVWVAILLQGSNPASFLATTCFVVTFCITFALLCVLYSPADVRQAFRIVSMQRASTRQELEVALALFTTMNRLFLATGPFGLVLGMIRVLEGLGRDSMEAFGEGLAISLECILYSALGALFIAVIGQGAAKKKLALLDKEAEGGQP